MYSRGIFGSCFWNSVFSPVRMMRDRGSYGGVGTLCTATLEDVEVAAVGI